MRVLIFIFTFIYWNFISAQQNLFNIPSGDVTSKQELFYQHQLNFYEYYKFESKSHFVKGLGKGWEIGVNLINAKFNFNNPNFFVINETVDGLNDSALSPLFLLTGQKQFALSEKIKLNLGTQIGTNFAAGWQNKQFAHFTYALVQFELPHHIKLIGGGYLSNDAFLGTGNDKGFMLGYEIPLSKRWWLMGDHISGHHSNGMSVIGGLYNISNSVQICFGGLISNRYNQQFQADFGDRFIDALVIELNLLSWDLW